MKKLRIVPTTKPTDWPPGDHPACAMKSRYGEIWWVNMTEGERTHTRPLFIDRGGTVTVVADRQGNLVLETLVRPVCKIGEKIELPITDPEAVLGSLESTELEFARGCSRAFEDSIQTGLREAGEEISLRPEDVIVSIPLGEAFLNGFNPQPNKYVLFIVDRKVALKVPELAKLNEAIEHVEWVSEDQVNQLIADGIIRDIQTLAAYAKYQAMRKVHPELFQ